MGRSQVKRNQAARGRGRGGRGSSGGGRGSYGNQASRRKKSGGDLSDNSFRYDRSSTTTNTSSSDDLYDGLLDDINLLPSAGLSEYYGHEEEDDLLPTIASLSLSTSNNNKQQNVNNNVAEDWMSIDIKALDKCLKQIPLHERLKIPKHIGDYLQDKYYNDGVEHKKTIAQLREDAKCIVPEEEEIQEELEETSKKNGIVQHDNEDNVSEEEDEDLESWLDDMIA